MANRSKKTRAQEPGGPTVQCSNQRAITALRLFAAIEKYGGLGLSTGDKIRPTQALIFRVRPLQDFQVVVA